MASLAHCHHPCSATSGRGRTGVLPGIGLCLAVTGAAYALEAGERTLAGKAWLEALVLAILIGTAVRSLWTPGERWHDGIAWSAKYLLEVAVVLLGASVSAATILAAGPALLVGIAGVVASAILLSFGIGRLLGLPSRMALLVACGNSICGNSAIAAVAPVIGADSDDVAASIAFTAVLGVAVVLGLPLLGIALGMSGLAFGALAGLTVYAVPQVIAAASPLGAVAVQTGTLVKLVRVLMLGPVCLVLSLVAPRLAPQVAPDGGIVAGETLGKRPGPPRALVHRRLPRARRLPVNGPRAGRRYRADRPCGHGADRGVHGRARAGGRRPHRREGRGPRHGCGGAVAPRPGGDQPRAARGVAPGVGRCSQRLGRRHGYVRPGTDCFLPLAGPAWVSASARGGRSK